MVGEGAENWPGWDEACQREAAIRDLINRYPKRLRVAVVDDVAWELGVSRATLYRLIERYRTTRTVEGLCGPGRGRREGSRFLNPAQETLIREIIEREYLKPTRPPFRRVLEHIGLACRRRGWPAPTWRTVKSRLLLIDQRVRAVRRGDVTAARAMEATPGEYTARRQWVGFPQPSLCASVPQPGHPGRLAPSRETPFRRAHRTADRHANGRGASPARHDIQQPQRAGRVSVLKRGPHDDA